MQKTKYYGKEVEKALVNFPFSYPQVHTELIFAVTEIKEAAALAHEKNGELEASVAHAIVEACREIRKGTFEDQFPVTALQGGAGTSTNMNVNEVVAKRAEEILLTTHTPSHIHPNDHVNKSQSTNDVNPSALKIASIRLILDLFVVLDVLAEEFEQKSQEFSHIQKLGRTHLQDAVPMTLGEEFQSWVHIIQRGKKRLDGVLPFFYELNLGGTAIGNSMNASKEYQKRVYEELWHITKLPFVPAENLASQTGSQSDFLMLSQTLVAITLDISKIASDLRLLSSGPNGGFGEIRIQELQSGSSIMPGKVNPVLPEVVNQLYFMVSGNNVSIEQAAHAAQLELGAMFPLLADRLLSSLKVTSEVLQQFGINCIHTIRANEKKCKENLERSTAYATLLTPLLGYDVVNKMVKEANDSGKTIREVILKQQLLTEDELTRVIGN